jgi:uncharacterized membrane protein
MEEKFLHAWDELDETLCLCRHVATLVLADAWDLSVSFATSAAGTLLAATATLLLGVRQFLDPAA